MLQNEVTALVIYTTDRNHKNTVIKSRLTKRPLIWQEELAIDFIPGYKNKSLKNETK